MKKIKSYILNMIIIVYAIYDVLSSASAGNANKNRTSVYIFLCAIMFIMFLTIVFIRYIRFEKITKWYLIYLLYFCIDNFFIKEDSGWSGIASFAVVFWWFLSLLYFQSMQDKSYLTYYIYKIFTRGVFILYLAVLLYSARNISSHYSSVTYARVGYIYHLLSLLPFILLEQNKKVKNFFVGLLFVAAVFSFKRGAIISLPIALLAYYSVENYTGYGKHNLRRIILLFVVFVIAWIGIDYYSNGYLSSRFTRIEISQGSGRSEVIASTMKNISTRNMYQHLFGLQSNQEHTLSIGAHNEWVMQLDSYGIIGMILYGCIMLSLVFFALKLIKRKSVLAASFSAMVVYSLLIGMVSGWLFMHSTLYIMMYIGIVMSLYRQNDDLLMKILCQRKGEFT